MKWIVYAVRCANSNPKLRSVFERRGFQIQDVTGYGQAFYIGVDSDFTDMWLRLIYDALRRNFDDRHWLDVL